MGTMRTSQLFHKPLQPLHLGSASTKRENTYPLRDGQFKWNLSLFVWLCERLLFFLESIVQTNYEKEQKMVPFFSDKTKGFGL